MFITKPHIKTGGNNKKQSATQIGMEFPCGDNPSYHYTQTLLLNCIQVFRNFELIDF